jgi:hypothetical protein
MSTTEVMPDVAANAAPAPIYEELDPKEIRLNAGTQPREQADLFLVKDYAEVMEGGVGIGLGKDDFPPPVVFTDGKGHWVADGYHRIKAAILAGRGAILCEVRRGDIRDATLYAAGANWKHGKRRSAGDKRRNVLKMLNDRKWGSRTNAWIADQCKVSPSLVASLRFESINPDAHGPYRTTTRNGEDVLVKTSAPAKPKAPAARAIPRPTAAQQNTAVSAFHQFVRSLRDRRIEVDVHHRTERLGVAVVRTRRDIFVVEPVLTVPAFKEAFATVFLARQELDPKLKLKATIVGRRTAEVAEWIALAAAAGVGFLELA